MPKPKISKERVKEIQEALLAGMTVIEAVEKFKVRKTIVSEIYNGSRVYCVVCDIAHDGPICRTAGEKRLDLMKQSGDCTVCGKFHPMKPCPDIHARDPIQGVRHNVISFGNKPVFYQGNAK